MTIDANQAMALLDTVHHFAVKRMNRDDGVPGIEVTITHNGCRVCCHRRTFVEATQAAFAKLKDRQAKKLGLRITP